MTRQDAAFYTTDDGNQVVWEQGHYDPFFVVRAGEMLIFARETEGGESITLRTTEDLESFGIKTDSDLSEWEAKGDSMFAWVHNPWFEVYNDSNTNYCSEPFQTLDEAIAHAKEWNIISKEREYNE